MSIQIVLMLPPEAASVSLARHTTAEALRIAGVAPDCIHEAEVALSEACTNVFYHVDSDQNFEVLVNIGDQQLTMHILDSGNGFRRREHAHGMATHPAENARGLALMSAFTDDASFETDGAGGSVCLVKDLRWTPDAALLPPAG